MIIVGVDDSATSRRAVEWAADDALRMRVPLRLVHAVDRSPYQIERFADPRLPDLMLREGRKLLDEAEQIVRQRQPSVEVEASLAEGVPAEVLRREGDDATELVLGGRRLGGIAGALLGSVSTRVAGHTRCPVVVVPAERRPTYGEVVVGVDDSPECEPALAYAFEQARLRGSRLRAVHAWQLPVHAFAPEATYDMDEVRTARQQLVSDRLARFGRRHPDVQVVEDVHCAEPVNALTDAGEHADLLVVGSHGRGAVASLVLGSVSRGTLRHARCPVAVVRSR
ncbi:Nucleotide-binding universal stress protein, UspA family [Nonomuraea maritima]|uniref:Nucleotide-binding universal stress protein, UspA family n=1 Tax=Nonomuraea maritima TaxID=683260 RepID=A0A1G9BMV3_9ACTN|nr:universal stress protein [Nonomuraea maritima]SDK40839.1 Nucleotide-binding universal stress protein, UspA family [Nonomuraea maritima]